MNKTTKIIAGVLFLILVIYLLDDLGIINLSSLFGRSGDALALLAEKTKSVEIKRAKELTWNEARGEEKLFDQDSVLTFEGSTVQVNFLSGPKMKVLENSLVVISAPTTAGGPLELTLGRGSYHLVVNENQKIKINGIAFTAKNNSELLTQYENAKPTVRIVSGDVDVAPLEMNGQAQTAHQGQTVPVNVKAVSGPSPMPAQNLTTPPPAPTASPTVSPTVSASPSPGPTATPSATPRHTPRPTPSPNPTPNATLSPSPRPAPTPTATPKQRRPIPKPTPSPTPKKKAKKMLQFKVIRDDNGSTDGGGATSP